MLGVIFTKFVVQMKILKCKGCGNVKPIVNVKYGLCSECNKQRLNAESSKPTKTPKPIKKTSLKRLETLKRDKETYFEVFQSKEPVCEGCGCLLPNVFEANDQIIAIWQYSHILSKGSFPELRHNPKNFNRLCFKCHQIWEFGGEEGRKELSCYDKNQEIISELYESIHKKGN